MPIAQAIKDRAYKIDPPCWKSYSGKDKRHKQRMDSRRTASLAQAEKEISINYLDAPAEQPDAPWLPTIEVPMTPLHILIGIHYYSRPIPYAWDRPEERYSKAVRAYTEDLVRAGLLTRREPDGDDVSEHIRNTAEYAATEGLRMWVDALTDVPLPKLRTAWVHPTLSPRAVTEN